MTGEERRQQILLTLSQESKPVSASRLAKKYSVSRQIIVGDVALLRAAEYPIVSTARGYLLVNQLEEMGYRRKIVCYHTAEQTQEELNTIVSHGGEVLDIIVTHEIYGELRGDLFLSTYQDVEIFLKLAEQSKHKLLTELTGGLHTHTIRCKDAIQFHEIVKALTDKQLLYEMID